MAETEQQKSAERSATPAQPERREERPLTRRGGGLVPFEDIDRWFDDFFRDIFPRRWLQPFFERGWPELRAPLEGRLAPFEGR
jgi:hypothetical protein